MPQFTFNLDNFQITQTRSAHTDTVYASLTVRVGSESAPATVSTLKSLGNLNNGTFSTGLTCPNVTIVPRLPVVFNYLIVNAGSAAALDVRQAIDSVGALLTETPSLNLPGFASSLALVAGEYSSILNPIFKKGSCDGLVAAEQNSFTYEDLLNYTARSPYFTQATKHIGTPAGSGCNSNGSAYLVHWSMLQVAEVPSVVGLQLGQVGQPGTAVDELSKAGFGYKANGKGTWVQGQSAIGLHSVSDPVILTMGTSAR